MCCKLMNNPLIREATVEDVPLVAQFLRAMLAEMTMMGGHPLADDPAAWAHFEANIRAELGNKDHIYLLANLADFDKESVGLAEARIVPAAPIFQSKSLLHIHALYVLETCRKYGIGRALLNALLAWGRDRGCPEAELNTLAANPARTLYENSGFAVSEVRMTRRL
jgi:GNAT superfamily N-acetyltransferase